MNVVPNSHGPDPDGNAARPDDPDATGERHSRGRSLVRELRHDKLACIGVALLTLIVFAALAAPILAPYDPARQSLSDRLMPPAFQKGGSWHHFLGTDNLGRDVLSRLLYGSRVSLAVGILVVILSGVIGIGAGVIAGYKGGRIDSIIMRLVDTQMAFPGLLLALVILTVLRPSASTIVVVLALNGWMVYARVARGMVLSIKETPFVESAEIVGCTPSRVVWRHVLPTLVPTLMVLAVLEMARVILTEAALSFLGVGIQPPSTSWGLDIAIGQEYIFNAWWLITFPGVAIAVTVLSANLVASWLQVMTNPHQRERQFAASMLAQRST